MKKSVYLCGGTALFRQGLSRLCGKALQIFDSPHEMPLEGTQGNSLYVILPDYEKREFAVPALDIYFTKGLAQRKKAGDRIYIENYPSRDYLAKGVFGYFTIGNMRYVYQEYAVLNDGKVLQCANSFYYPATVAEKEHTLLSLQDCVGLHEVVREGTFSFPVLTDDRQGCVSSMMNLTDFDSLFMKPYVDWKRFLSSLWADLLELDQAEVERVFEELYENAVRISGGTDEKKALEKALAWHLDSGLLYAPDGTMGAYEMIRSDDLSFRTNFRTDSILMTGALLCSAGNFLKRDDLMQCGKNLGHFVLNSSVQTPEGMIHWYENQTTVFANDLARHILSLYRLWEETSQECFLLSARKAADAAAEWIRKNGGFCCGYFHTETGYDERSGVPSGVYHGELSAALLKVDAEKYGALVAHILDDLDWESTSIGHSRPDVWSRCFLLYACAHNVVRDCSGEITEFLDYYETLRDPVYGGFREEDLFLRRSAPLEAGVAQGHGKDHIADLLYCNNYLFAVLEILRRKMPSDQQICRMYEDLKKFILQIQISSDDKRFNGGWMRAFDMQIGEYYGLLMDRDWGPYCIMAGWTMGIIPFTLLADLGQKPFFDNP